MKRLIYVSDIGSAFFSQVFELLKYYSKEKVFKNIYFIGLLSEKTNKEDIKNLRDLLLNLNIKPYLVKVKPFYPIISKFTINKIRNKISEIEIDENTIFHCRSEIIAYLFSVAAEKNKVVLDHLLVDVRGALPEEIKWYSHLPRIFKYLKILYVNYIHKNFLHKVGAISCVSEKLKEYLLQKNKKLRKIYVTPCIAGENFYFNSTIRDKMRKRLLYNENDIVLTFSSGGSAEWQKEGKLKEIVENITIQNKNIKVLFLTKKKYFRNTENIKNIFVPYEEVPKYLMASDIGIILRDRDIINEVACPIKFCEYLATGLPVISNNAVDIIVQILKKYRCGLVLEKIDTISIINSIKVLNELQKNRYQISEIGRRLFGVENIARKYIDIYKNLRR